MKAVKLTWKSILAVLLAMSFAVCTYAQENSWSKPLYIPSQKVEASYKHPLPIPDLVDGLSGDAKYRVRASRHDGPGPIEAEIHMLDTNIFFVTSGEATLVVGGKVVDAKETEPFEWRGTSIEGGTAYRLKKGDIMIVPRGTPLWFKNVPDAPFLFFEVKVQ